MICIGSKLTKKRMLYKTRRTLAKLAPQVAAITASFVLYDKKTDIFLSVKEPLDIRLQKKFQ